MSISVCEPRPLFTAKFLSFYDPNQDFSVSEHSALLTWLCDGRSDAYDLTERVNQGVRVLAKEMVHALLMTPDDISNAQGLGIEEEELKGIVDGVVIDARSTVGSIRDAVEYMKWDNPSIGELAKTEDPMELVLHGAMASVLSHRYQQRRDNGSEFSEHPRAAAAIVDIATRRAFQNRNFSNDDLADKNRTEYMVYRHDGALEDMMSSEDGERNKTFLRGDGLNVSPLVDLILLQELGEERPVAYYIATGLVRLTKTVGFSGRRKWRPYIKELAMPAPEAPMDREGLVTLGKRCEMHHNATLDKKLLPGQKADENSMDFAGRKARHMRKAKDYSWADRQLRDYLNNPLGFPTLVGSKIKTVKKQDLCDYFLRGDRLPALLTREILLSAYDRAQSA